MIENILSTRNNIEWVTSWCSTVGVNLNPGDTKHKTTNMLLWGRE